MANKRPPPIQWMTVFEASARLRSFRKAADALNVSPPAISQQIKALEDYLDIKLFDRRGKQLELTPAGEFYFKIASRTIESHTQGFYEFDRRFKRRSLQISTPLFIAQEMLIPNYVSFRDYAAGAELRMTTGTEYVDFETGSADAAIRFGDGEWPDLEARLLCHVEIAMTASAQYIESNGLQNISVFDTKVLNQQTLIAMTEDYLEWKAIFPDVRPKDVLVCDSYFSVIKSAENGLGIANAILPAVNSWINDGRIRLISNMRINNDLGYWLVYPKQREPSDLIDGCYRWAKSLFVELPEIIE